MPEAIRRARRGGILPPALTLLLATGCLALSDPEPPAFGARMAGDTIVVKIPLCPTDEIRRVEVHDFDDEQDPPRTLWWATDPTSASVRAGVVELWTGEGFTKHATRPAESAIPADIEVDYEGPAGEGGGYVFTVGTLAKATLGAGEYWTDGGAMTAGEIDAQLGCGDG